MYCNPRTGKPFAVTDHFQHPAHGLLIITRVHNTPISQACGGFTCIDAAGDEHLIIYGRGLDIYNRRPDIAQLELAWTESY